LGSGLSWAQLVQNGRSNTLNEKGNITYSFSDALFRTHFFVRTFSDALFKSCTVASSVGLFSKLTTNPTKPGKPTENQRIFDS
jgi:hypothetical protein